MALFLTLGVHKLKAHSIPFKRNPKPRCKIISTSLQHYNKKSIIIVALFHSYRLFKSISHFYALLEVLGLVFNSPWVLAFTPSSLRLSLQKFSHLRYKIVMKMKLNTRLKLTPLAIIILIVLVIVIILTQNLTTTTDRNSAYFAKEKGI